MRSDGYWQTFAILGTQRTYWLEDLTCGQKYNIRMRAINKEGPSDYTKTLTAKTTGKSESINVLFYLLQTK